MDDDPIRTTGRLTYQSPGAGRFVVLLDGQPIRGVIELDTEQGWIRGYALGVGLKPVRSKRTGELVTYLRHGEVRVLLKDKRRA